MTHNNPSSSEMQRIAAFADGELGGEDNLHVLEKSQHDAQVASKIRHQQQLRRACQRVMRDPCECPCTVKDRLKTICDEFESDDPPVLARIGRWAPALVAAMLLFAAVMVYHNAFETSKPTSSDGASIIPVSQAEQFSSRHDTCSRSLETLHNLSKYAGDLTALPKTISDKLGTPVPALDLTAFGYQFAGAGDCLLPGTTSVHLVYKPVPGSGHTDSVSLWMCPDHEELAIEPGQIYTRQCPKTGRKLLVWRHSGVTYYLIGDDPARVQTIADSLQNVT